ncbi:MAG TPA: hypothetical protein PLA74_07275, partial [Syntrophales bacterium]|nr:hypothetical protein [Syntrophales bacterium]
CLYDPRSFIVLKTWLDYMSSLREMDDQAILAHAGGIHPSLEAFLSERRFSEVWPRLVENSGDKVHLNSHFSRWFDGFETFKLVRYLTNNGLPPVDMFVALQRLMEMMAKKLPVDITPGIVPSFQMQMEILEYLREIDR